MKTLAFLVLLIILCGCTNTPSRYSAEFIGLFDTITVITGYADNQEQFEYHVRRIFDRLEDLHRLFDKYNRYDGLNNLYTINAMAGVSPVEVRQEIIDLLLFAKEGYEISGGTVNVALGPVLSIWHQYRRLGLRDGLYAALPSMDDLKEAAELSDISNMIIDEEARTVFLLLNGMSLDVGAIAKSFAIGIAARESDMEALLINSGWDIYAKNPPLSRPYWNVGIHEGKEIIQLSRGAVAVSSNHFRQYVVDGQVMGHIIDPGTLMPARRFNQVVVIHSEPEMADLLSTALFIMSREDGEALAERMGAEAFWY